MLQRKVLGFSVRWVKNDGELRWVARKSRNVWPLQVVGYILTFAGSMLMLTDPFLVKWLIDDVLQKQMVSWLPVVAAAFVFSYIGRVTLNGLGAMIGFRALQRLASDIRLDLLRRLDSHPMAFHEEMQIGDLMSRVDSDVEVVSTLSCEMTSDVVRVAGMGLTVVAVMLYLNPQLTLIVLPFVPVFLIATGRLRRDLGRHSDQVQQMKARLSGFLQEHLQNIVQIWLLAKEETESSRFSRFLEESVRAQITRRKLEIVFGALVYFLVVVGVALVLSYGGYLVINGQLTTGGLVAFYGYTLQLFGPLCGLADLYAKSQRLFSSVRRLKEIEKVRYEIPVRDDGIRLENRNGYEIEFRDVDCSYPGGRRVLQKVNLRVEKGERVGIIGANGSGKSTLVKLLARLYDVDGGRVLVGGFDVRDLELKSLRRSVAYVGPLPMLRDATVLENVLDGNPEAAASEVMTAATMAGLCDVIARQPKAWYEPLGPRTRLSTGEQQRVALARALLMRPQILILDECLAAVDAETEKTILQRLNEFGDSLTIILISHRSYLYDWADRVILLNRGQLLSDPSCVRDASLSVA